MEVNLKNLIELPASGKLDDAFYIEFSDSGELDGFSCIEFSDSGELGEIKMINGLRTNVLTDLYVQIGGCCTASL